MISAMDKLSLAQMGSIRTRIGRVHSGWWIQKYMIYENKKLIFFQSESVTTSIFSGSDVSSPWESYEAEVFFSLGRTNPI